MRSTLLLPTLLLGAAAMAVPVAAAFAACETGSYELAGGGYVDIAPADGGRLRWRLRDGRTGALTPGSGGLWTSTMGWTNRDDGKRIAFDCSRSTIDFEGIPGTRIAFDVKNTRFDVQGARLAGRLLLPEGDQPVPIAVLVHGAEQTSARETYALQRMFPAAGIGAFVYDKRGTGGSDGRYTQNYLTLAVDAVAAFHEAKRLAGDRAGRVGFQAGSQGGWVAPLAAAIVPVDFIVVGFGLAVSPLQAEREQLALDVAGYGPDVHDKAMKLADAVDAVIESNFQDGYERLTALFGEYRKEPWFEGIRGSITRVLLETPAETLKADGPELAPAIPFHYDPMPVLRNLRTPQLWILAADDVIAPPPETSRRLTALARAGRPITTAVFPDTDHGIYEYEIGPDGERVSTRAPAGYFAMMRDFIRDGRIDGEYGADILRAAAEGVGSQRDAEGDGQDDGPRAHVGW